MVDMALKKSKLIIVKAEPPLKTMANDFFGFDRMHEQEAVKAFYGPAYELIKKQELEDRRMETLRRRVLPDLVDEYSSQINKSLW